MPMEDKHWYSYYTWLNFDIFNTKSKDLRRIQTAHNLFCRLDEMKPAQLVGQVADFKVESKFQPPFL